MATIYRHRGIVKKWRTKRDESSMRLDNEFPRNADFSINYQTSFYFDGFLWPILSSFSFGRCRDSPLLLSTVSPTHLFSLRTGKTRPTTRLFPFPRLRCTLYGHIFFWKDLPHGSRNRWAVLKSLSALLPPLLRQVSKPSSRHSHGVRQKCWRNSSYEWRCNMNTPLWVKLHRVK